MTLDADGNEIAVLAVTADPAFATDCRERLSETGSVQVTTETTVEMALGHLTSGERIDCVVSDHDLPDTDGIALLEAVRVQRPTLPFVLFTDGGDERVASRAISLDVTEYLVRDVEADQWGRLRGLIENAVAVHRQRQRLTDTETRVRTLLDSVPDAIAVVQNGRFAYANRAAVDLFGVASRDEIVGQPAETVLGSDGETDPAAALSTIEAGQRTLRETECTLPRSDGTVPVELTATHVEWENESAAMFVAREITGRRQRERDLELKTRAIESAPIGITIADASQPDNPMVYVNEWFQRITGYEEEECLGRNCRFLQGPDTDPETVAEMRTAIDDERPVTVEVRNYRRDGTGFWNRVTVAPVRDGDGEVTHYVGFQEDVTDRKESEHELRQFRRVVEAAGHAIYITEPDGTITYVNPALERITGYDAETAVGRDPSIFSSGEMPDSYYERLWKTVSGGDVWEEEILDRRRSGELYHAHQTIAPVLEDGEVAAFVAIQTDVSDQKEREQRLRQYEQAVEAANDMIAAVDTDYQFLFANESYRTFYGLDPEQVTETRLPDVVDEETWEAIRPYVDRKFDGEYVQFETVRTAPDGTDRTFDVRYHPLRNNDGEVYGAVATLRDLTDQRTRERQLAALERMLRHNLQNELNVILGRAELVEERASDEVAALSEPIAAAAQRLLETADKQRRVVELLAEPSSVERLNLSVTVETVVEQLEDEYLDAEIVVDSVPDIELRTTQELGRAIEELIENAILHGGDSPSQVRVKSSLLGDRVRISVSDDGPGIPETERSVIEEDADIEPLLHSSGMGLWLVKRIVSGAGGTIRFDDAGSGTTVTIVLPTDSTARRNDRHDRTTDG